MRSFRDEHGIVGWIFDEKTHPLGNEFNKQEVKPKVEVVVEKKFDKPKKK